MKTWIKLYTEINRDPKMGSLSWAQRGIWSAVLALAGEIDERDEDDVETGAVGSLHDAAWHLRCNQQELLESLTAFELRDMAYQEDDIWYISNYTARQGRAPSQKRKAVAKRVKEHRETKQECNEDVTPLHEECNEDVTQLDKSRVDKSRVETEQNREDYNRKEAGSLQLLSDFYQTSIKQYEANIGVVAPAQIDDIKDMLAELEQKGLQDWWYPAIKIAVDANVRKWTYLRATLTNCIQSGKAPSNANVKKKLTKKKAKTIDPFTGEQTEVEVYG